VNKIVQRSMEVKISVNEELGNDEEDDDVSWLCEESAFINHAPNQPTIDIGIEHDLSEIT
jgi:hypothetical protein